MRGYVGCSFRLNMARRTKRPTPPRAAHTKRFVSSLAAGQVRPVSVQIPALQTLRTSVEPSGQVDVCCSPSVHGAACDSAVRPTAAVEGR